MSQNTTIRTPRIVVGLDGSPSSLAALHWAVRQAKLTGGTVDAVTAWQIPASMTGYGWAPVALTDCYGMEGIARQALEEAIGATVDPADRPLVHGRIVQGSAAKVLLDASAGADLLVLGNRGHGGFTEALVGSVGQHCIHHAHCPVMIMRGGSHAMGSPAGPGKKVPATAG